jgi:hypothetical protein
MRLNIDHYERPYVFVSSTADTLTTEWRSQIATYLADECGYRAMMWEDGRNFPFATTAEPSPAWDAVKAVTHSHVCIVVVGKRYGTTSPDGVHSWTHLEYLKAAESNIPVLVFALKSVWDARALYERNRSGDFSSVVDDVRVFDLLREVCGSYLVTPFETGSDIVVALRGEFAKMMGAFLRFSRAASWIWCEEQTENIEESADVIWIGTPDLYWDAEDPAFRRVVRANVIQRKTTYHYVVIDTPENRNRFLSMVGFYRQQLGDVEPDNVAIKWVPEESYPWPGEVALYEPNVPAKRRAVIVNAMEVQDRSRKYNVELGPSGCRRVFDKFNLLFEI